MSIGKLKINKDVIKMDLVLHRIMDLLWSRNEKEQDFCNSIKINRSAVTDWKSGKTKSYQNHIDLIAEHFNVSTNYILGCMEENEIKKIAKEYFEELHKNKLKQEYDLDHIDSYIEMSKKTKVPVTRLREMYLGEKIPYFQDFNKMIRYYEPEDVRFRELLHYLLDFNYKEIKTKLEEDEDVEDISWIGEMMEEVEQMEKEQSTNETASKKANEG